MPADRSPRAASRPDAPRDSVEVGQGRAVDRAHAAADGPVAAIAVGASSGRSVHLTSTTRSVLEARGGSRVPGSAVVGRLHDHVGGDTTGERGVEHGHVRRADRRTASGVRQPAHERHRRLRRPASADRSRRTTRGEKAGRPGLAEPNAATLTRARGSAASTACQEPRAGRLSGDRRVDATLHEMPGPAAERSHRRRRPTSRPRPSAASPARSRSQRPAAIGRTVPPCRTGSSDREARLDPTTRSTTALDARRTPVARLHARIGHRSIAAARTAQAVGVGQPEQGRRSTSRRRSRRIDRRDGLAPGSRRARAARPRPARAAPRGPDARSSPGTGA